MPASVSAARLPDREKSNERWSPSDCTERTERDRAMAETRQSMSRVWDQMCESWRRVPTRWVPLKCLLLFAWSIGLGTCSHEIIRSQPFTPPAHYREIWAEAEKCSGKTGNFDLVKWSQAPGREFHTKMGWSIGYWNSPHTIILGAEWLTTDWVAMHEMIHDLTGFTHDGDIKGPGPRDIQVWGKQCHAMWGYLTGDPGYRP